MFSAWAYSKCTVLPGKGSVLLILTKSIKSGGLPLVATAKTFIVSVRGVDRLGPVDGVGYLAYLMTSLVQGHVRIMQLQNLKKPVNHPFPWD